MANVEKQVEVFLRLEAKVRDTLAGLGPLEIAPAPERQVVSMLPPPPEQSKTSFVDVDVRDMDAMAAEARARAKEPRVVVVGDNDGIRVGSIRVAEWPKGGRNAAKVVN